MMFDFRFGSCVHFSKTLDTRSCARIEQRTLRLSLPFLRRKAGNIRVCPPVESARYLNARFVEGFLILAGKQMQHNSLPARPTGRIMSVFVRTNERRGNPF
jgi:hypothetical protein